MNSNLSLCSKDSACFYSFMIFDIIAFFPIFFYIAIFAKKLKVIQKKHFLFYSIRIISNFVLLFATSPTISKIKFIVINFIDFITVIIQLYLMFSEIIDLTEGKNIFKSDVSFHINNFSIFFFFIILSKFPISVLIEFEFFLDFQLMLFIIYFIIFFGHIYSKLNNVISFIKEKDTSHDWKKQILLINFEVFDLHKIYSVLKSVIFINFSIFLFYATISFMNKFVTNRFIVTLMLYAVVFLKEIICLVHFGGLSIIYYRIKKKEEDIGDIIENKEDSDGSEEEIDVELGVLATQS